jgi:PAS domain S-box-containing protein
VSLVERRVVRTGSPAADPGHQTLAVQFPAILGAIPDTLVLISPELRVLWANRAAAEKLGVTEADLRGRLCHEVWHSSPTPCPVCPVQGSYASGRPECREVTDPAGRLWDLRTAPVVSGDGVVTGVVELARDITEHRRLEERLAHAQRLEAVGRLAGSVAHDFNNYLAAIVGFSELALLDLPEGAPAREPVAQARETARTARNVTRQLLAFSRREPVQRRPVDLAALLASRAAILRQLAGAGVSVEQRVAAGLRPVLADPAQIDQALANLVVNASEAMPQGGAITIEAADRTLDAGDAGPDCAPGEYVALRVSDTGTGMDAATLERLFEPFFTTKPSGTGLGLAAVQGVARASGGDVRVESAPGAGTRVEILLPRA